MLTLSCETLCSLELQVKLPSNDPTPVAYSP